MSLKLKEKDFYLPIKEELLSLGFPFPIDDEVGINMGDYKRRVDVFACKWDEAGKGIVTIGIEVKYDEGKSISNEFSQGISQSIDYLPFFSYIFIANRKGVIRQHWLDICNQLSINRIQIDDKIQNIKFPTTFKKSRFTDDNNEKSVQLRSSMILSFVDVFGKRNVIFGEFRNGGGWLAVNYTNNLQIHTYYDMDKEVVKVGLNLEHKKPFIKLVNRIRIDDLYELESISRKFTNYEFQLVKDRRAPNKTENLFQKKAFNKLTGQDFRNIINLIKQVVEGKHWRPHITISKPLWNDIKSKEWHYNTLQNEMKKLTELVNFFEKFL